MEVLSFVAGIFGMIVLILGYLFLSTGRLNQRSLLYQLCNLLGASGLLVNTYVAGAWPTFALNIVWAFIAISAIIQIIYKRK